MYWQTFLAARTIPAWPALPSRRLVLLPGLNVNQRILKNSCGGQTSYSRTEYSGTDICWSDPSSFTSHLSVVKINCWQIPVLPFKDSLESPCNIIRLPWHNTKISCYGLSSSTPWTNQRTEYKKRKETVVFTKITTNICAICSRRDLCSAFCILSRNPSYYLTNSWL